MKEFLPKSKSFSWKIKVELRNDAINSMKSKSSSGQSQQSRGCKNDC